MSDQGSATLTLLGSNISYFTGKMESFIVEMDNSSSELIDYFLKRRADKHGD